MNTIVSVVGSQKKLPARARLAAGKACWDAESLRRTDPEMYRRLVREGYGEPENVAKAVLFLASEDSAYINAV